MFQTNLGESVQDDAAATPMPSTSEFTPVPDTPGTGLSASMLAMTPGTPAVQAAAAMTPGAPVVYHEQEEESGETGEEEPVEEDDEQVIRRLVMQDPFTPANATRRIDTNILSWGESISQTAGNTTAAAAAAANRPATTAAAAATAAATTTTAAAVTTITSTTAAVAAAATAAPTPAAAAVAAAEAQTSATAVPPTPSLAATPAEMAGVPSAYGASAPVIHNVVATANLQCQLVLREIAMKVRNTEYNPRRFSAVVMRIREPKATALVFGSGKIVVAGTHSEEDARLAARKVARVIKKVGNDTRFTEFKVQNIVATFHVPYPIHLEELQRRAPSTSHYEPEVFPGLIFRMQLGKVSATLLIFVSGKCVVIGVKKKEVIQEVHKQIARLLYSCRKK